MIRYADDFICCFQYKEEAEAFLMELEDRLSKFSLEISSEKTKLIEFGRFAEDNRRNRGDGKPDTFDFLGFTHYCSKSMKGKFRVKRKTSRKKFKSKLNKCKVWLRLNMHEPVKILIQKLNKKLKGHYNYYGITDNYSKINSFKYHVTGMLVKTLRRRSQRKQFTWDKFRILQNRYPIAKPKITVCIYS